MGDGALLTVILGAGASYDCIVQHSSNAERAPRLPLTDELFSARFHPILSKYPGVGGRAHVFRDLIPKS